jgi:alanine-synthesizing transaminase
MPTRWESPKPELPWPLCNREKGNSSVTADDVVMANGASEAITLAIAALVNPGDNIMTPSPGYPLYSGQIPVYHGELNPYLLNESTGWQIDFDELERRVNSRTKAIVVINPNNPTGAITVVRALRIS